MSRGGHASPNGLIGTHLIPASMEHGIPEVMAASLLASIGLLDIIGSHRLGLALGPLGQRYLPLLVLQPSGALATVPALRVRLGLPRPRRLRDLLWTRLGGHGAAELRAWPRTRSAAKNVGIMFGWIAASHQLGAAAAAYGGGLLHTWLGDYQVTFMSAGLVCLDRGGPRAPHRPGFAPACRRG